MKQFEQIKGACLAAVAAPGDELAGLDQHRNDWRLVFDQGLLVVENPFSLRCESDEPVSFESLIGCVVTQAYAMQDSFVVIFEGNLVLSVSLKEEDYASAAAASFLSRNGELRFALKPGGLSF